jgi:hypothetical protein
MSLSNKMEKIWPQSLSILLSLHNFFLCNDINYMVFVLFIIFGNLSAISIKIYKKFNFNNYNLKIPIFQLKKIG